MNARRTEEPSTVSIFLGLCHLKDERPRGCVKPWRCGGSPHPLARPRQRHAPFKVSLAADTCPLRADGMGYSGHSASSFKGQGIAAAAAPRPSTHHLSPSPPLPLEDDQGSPRSPSACAQRHCLAMQWSLGPAPLPLTHFYKMLWIYLWGIQGHHKGILCCLCLSWGPNERL